LSASPLFEGLRSVTAEPRYQVVFESRDALARTIDLVGALEVPAPLVAELGLLDRDSYTYRHVLVTTVLTARMLDDLGRPPAVVAEGACAALTHDIGKLRIPLAVLQKTTSLTAGERRLLREHPMIGSLLLQYYLGEEGTNARVAADHHERPDGSGYPRGIRLADPLVAVVAVNDIFDALISQRPYRRVGFDVRGALEFVWAEACAGRLDEAICRLLISYNRKGKPDPSSLWISAEARSSPPQESSYGKTAAE
jgi:HD-GYP domain-containing protein (c-di-GMP phosphodiesterase class II)